MAVWRSVVIWTGATGRFFCAWKGGYMPLIITVGEIREYPRNRIASAAQRYGVRWCHLRTNGSEEELVAFASSIGCPRSWLQKSGTPLVHYDLVPSKRAQAVAAGALEVPDYVFAAWQSASRINGERLDRLLRIRAVLRNVITQEGMIDKERADMPTLMDVAKVIDMILQEDGHPRVRRGV